MGRRISAEPRAPEAVRQKEEVALGHPLLPSRHMEAGWVSNPGLIPRSEGSERFGIASASAAQCVAASEVFVSRIAEKIFEGEG